MIIKNNYPNLDYKIIYISSTHKTNFIKENNLIILNTENEIITDWENCSIGLKNIFDRNKKFMDSILVASIK
jgi:hypothetical protein